MLISVIIPSYNSAKYISTAIDSVLTQTYQDFELIIIDDGSTDNTQEIIQSYKDSRITYIYQKNAGPAVARNNGIRIANGEYIAFLDADDYWQDKKLELQINKFKENKDLGFVYTAINNVSAEHELINIMRYKSSNSHDLIKQLLVNYAPVVPLPSSVMIKKAYLDNTGLFDINLTTGEDWDLWLRLAAISEICYIDEPLINRYKPDTSITSSQCYSNNERCHFLLLNKFFGNNPLKDRFKKYKSRAFSYIYYDISRLHFYKDRKNPPMREVLRTLFISFKYDPISYFTVYEKARYLFRLTVSILTGY